MSHNSFIPPRKPSDSRLTKHLISLRVHLSTSSIAWIEQFVGQEKGMDALVTLLSSLVGKGGKNRKLSDTEESVLLEVIKCLRVLLNTGVSQKFLQFQYNLSTLLYSLASTTFSHPQLPSHTSPTP